MDDGVRRLIPIGLLPQIDEMYVQILPDLAIDAKLAACDGEPELVAGRRAIEVDEGLCGADQMRLAILIERIRSSGGAACGA